MPEVVVTSGPIGSTSVSTRGVLWVSLAGLTALVLTACANLGNGDSGLASGGEIFAERIAAGIEEATASGASPNQLALLDSARTEGEVTLEMARAARRAYVECAAATGVEVAFEEKVRPDGWVSWLTMIDGSTTADSLQIARDCEKREAFWVTLLYSTQPTTVQATADYLEQQAPVLRACLEEAGFRPKPEADGMALAILSTQGSDPVMQEAGAVCRNRIGVDGF